MADTWEEYRESFARLADLANDWQGLPIPLAGQSLVLTDRHPMKEVYEQNQETDIEIVVGGSPDNGEEETIVNRWYNRRLNVDVIIYERGGKRFAVKTPRSPDSSMDRLTFWMNTIGASDAWDLGAEEKAKALLRSILSERQWRHYELTGSFLETSPRSNVTYVFRKLRPTIAMSPRQKPGSLSDAMRCLAVLCLHPIGYYRGTWAGCMVPTDDVIAHLTFMRGDEAHFWKEANQHEFWRPEAGL